jgi:signal transduction histidine kinase
MSIVLNSFAAMGRNLLLALGLVIGWHSATAQVSNVLVLYSNNRLLPANVEADRGLRESAARSPNGRVEIFDEFLDLPVFSGPEFERTFARYLRDKYVTRQPFAVVVFGFPALDFMLRHRAELFTGVPILHFAAEDTSLRSAGPLPADVVGIPLAYDFAGTIRFALGLHPRATRLVVVTGAAARDRAWEAQLRAALPATTTRLAVEYVSGLGHDDVLRRVRELGADDVVFTPGYFSDGAGRFFPPRESAAQIAAASAAPVYGPFGVGAGTVGGRVPDYREIGRQGGIALNALRSGASPTMLRLPDSPIRLQIDWNQVRRWGIDPALIPSEAVIQFKQPTFWEAYRTQILWIALVITLQAVLIAALLIERRSRRRTASALQESEDRMAVATRAAGLSVWAWDVARDRFWTSARFGKRKDLAGGQPVRFEQVLDIVHPADRDAFNRAVQHAASRGSELDVEYRVIQPDGEVRWFAARGSGTPKGSDRRLTGVTLDITARKAAELQAAKDRSALTHLTRVSTLGQLSASIAHQLNQPLAAILGNAEVAAKMVGQPHPDLAEVRAICEDIVKEDNRAAEVIRRLTALYKRGDVNLAPLDVNELVAETLELVRTEMLIRHVAISAQPAAELPPVEGDRVQLQQMLLNLVLNAADAMGETEVEQRKLVVSTAIDGENVRLDVVDSGSGIPPDSLKDVFGAFWTTKADGTGVGLAICQSIVTAHHGRLSVHNNPAGGACFSATWPLRHVAP